MLKRVKQRSTTPLEGAVRHRTAGLAYVKPSRLSLATYSARAMARHSKLQKQVLALYRQLLRAGQNKPGFLMRIRSEFRENASIPKNNVMHIEYLFRRGQRQLDQIKDANTKQLGAFTKTRRDS
ncbi:succinate dehydrogenase assembly factor 1, mitochondrial [Arapaima gigas]